MSLPKKLKVNGFNITQNKNGHVVITKNGTVVSHIQRNNELDDEELICLLEDVLKFNKHYHDQYINYDGFDNLE